MRTKRLRKAQESGRTPEDRYLLGQGLAALITVLAVLAAISGCSGGTSTVTSSQAASPIGSVVAGVNVAAVTVGCGYANEPCVSVIICVPGTSNCQTIPNVLLDTGSYGLRLFSSVSLDNFQTVTPLLSLPVTANPNSASQTLAECVSYADGSSDWGPLATADVQLGGEKAPSVPVQIINASFATIPSGCSDPDSSPIGASGTGFNGIIGVGLFAQDCGTGCTTTTNNTIYYTCPASGSGTCTGTTVALNLQTTNPVVYMPTDNNGVVLVLPAVPINFGTSDGAGEVTGSLVLGIGTQSNNTPSGTTVFAANSVGNFSTLYNGRTYTQAFIDSGSNAYYFPGSLTICSNASPFFCPSSLQTLSATQQSGSAQKTITFYVGNTDSDFAASNSAHMNFADLAGSMSGDFDWGLPFFYGRSVYVGVSSKSSSLGAGPLWAY